MRALVAPGTVLGVVRPMLVKSATHGSTGCGGLLVTLAPISGFACRRGRSSSTGPTETPLVERSPIYVPQVELKARHGVDRSFSPTMKCRYMHAKFFGFYGEPLQITWDIGIGAHRRNSRCELWLFTHPPATPWCFSNRYLKFAKRRGPSGCIGSVGCCDETRWSCGAFFWSSNRNVSFAKENVARPTLRHETAGPKGLPSWLPDWNEDVVDCDQHLPRGKGQPI